MKKMSMATREVHLICGRWKKFPRMTRLLVATFMLAMAGAAAGQIAGPISVLYWNGSSLNVIGPTSGYTIPAGATYAMDEASGTEFILIAQPGTAAPDPGPVPGENPSVPSITTPGGLIFEIPDAANIASIGTSDFAGGSVLVTYKDGSTAETPGTYNPPGSSPPPPAPSEQTPGNPFPQPDLQLVVPVQNALLNDVWVEDFLGGELTPTDLPTGVEMENGLYNGTIFNGPSDTIVQRFSDVPEPSTWLAGALLLLPLGVSALRILRTRPPASWPAGQSNIGT
jgi:hypothetical protein